MHGCGVTGAVRKRLGSVPNWTRKARNYHFCVCRDGQAELVSTSTWYSVVKYGCLSQRLSGQAGII